jgi:ribosome-associated protein
MDIRKLQRAIVDGLEDVKAQHIAVFNTEHLSPLFERVIVATGASNRQTKSLAASVRDTVRSRGLPVMRVEGEENGEWIIVDCGAAVVHIMQPAIREYYHLEEIWGGKPVKMKLAAAQPTRLVKAEEPAAPVRPAAKTPAKKAPAKKRASARRPASPREAPAQKAVRKIVVGRPARPAAKAAATKRRA